MMKKGYDPKSLGLIKYDYQNTDPKYTPVKCEGGLTTYVLKPEFFNEEDVQFLVDKYRLERPDLVYKIETSVYVGDVQIKGFKGHGEFETETVELCPIKLINNPFDGGNPLAYSQALVSGSALKYARHQLNYGSTIEDYTLDIRDLPNIEVNAETNITIKVGDFSKSIPLQHLLDPSRTPPILNVKSIQQTGTGFVYQGNIADTEFNSIFTKTYTQTAIVNGLTEFMLQNGNREAQLEQSQIYQLAQSGLSSLTSFDLVGGVGQALDAYLEFGLRNASRVDMAKQLSNVGGDIIFDAVGQSFDKLVTITYPIIKYSSGVRLGDFMVNNPKTFSVNKTFPDFNSALQHINETYMGTLVDGQIEPIVELGDYTQHFQRIIRLGGLQ